MELNYSKEKIEFEKELNQLDDFVIDFTKILNELDIKYVIVSGYVAILFGRNRSSEDVDMLIEKISYEKFKHLWKLLANQFECLNTENCEGAFNEYLDSKTSLRFCYKGQYLPNMEIKFGKDYFDEWTLNNKIKVVLNKNLFFISEIEPQISYKLVLGSKKDIEDARFLYKMFKDKLDFNKLDQFNRKFKIENMFNEYLK